MSRMMEVHCVNNVPTYIISGYLNFGECNVIEYPYVIFFNVISMAVHKRAMDYA